MGSPLEHLPDAFLAVDPILGYLNYGTGAFDERFFANLNAVYQSADSQLASAKSNADGGTGIDDRLIEDVDTNRETAKSSSDAVGSQDPFAIAGTTAAKMHAVLLDRLATLESESAAYRDSVQVRFAIEMVFDHVLPRYLKFHRDLFFHQTKQFLLSPFFVGRAFELVLQQIQTEELGDKNAFDSADRSSFSRAVVSQLNDFVGHRPVAALETQKLEPYAHEYFRPIPIYIKGAGVAHGPYHDLITRTLALIEATNSHILRAAQFDSQQMLELSIDARAFDFDHPINQRPNHHFGQWDDHTVGIDGFFQRFILHQVTLDALLNRVEDAAQADPPIPREEAMVEAASALACTMLMGSGISGSGPGSYDSNTTLGSLIPTIAGFRDQFYQELLDSISGEHQQRLLAEARQRHQPFGAVRQDLNAQLAHHRATQLVNCRLAAIFARMGYPEAATKQSRVVPVAAARIQCQIDCLLSSANDQIDNGQLDDAFHAVHRIVSRLKTGIGCGAVVDPWNIIGFDANYSLFPAMENTVRDHRVFDLLDMMDRLFALLSRITSEAAASDNDQVREDADQEFRQIVDWWRKYAAHEVSSVGAVDPEDLYEAASTVSQALSLWYKGGAAAGDMEFWAPHAELLDTPKAYSLVIDALMQRQDYKTCSALLVHWISRSDLVPLEQGDSSFHNLLFRWIAEQQLLLREVDAEGRDEIWERIRKLYDFLEVNAGDYWEVPEFSLAPGNFQKGIGRSTTEDYLSEFDELMEDDPSGEMDDDEKNLFRAAYDDVVFNDSTDDGVEGDVHDGGFDLGDDSLAPEVDRVLDRLEFLGTLSSFWCVAARIPLPTVEPDQLNDKIRDRLVKRRTFISNWVGQAAKNRAQLFELLASVNSYKLKINGSDREAMVQYDQQRLNKEMLLEHTINTCIETENAIRMLVGEVRAIDYLVDGKPLDHADDDESQSALSEIVNGGMPVVCVYAALVLRDGKQVAEHFDALTTYLHGRTPLYVPLSKGGRPAAIVNARVIQSGVLDMLRQLPTLGLFKETYELTQTTLDMERNNPVGGGAVTEFDEVFEVAYASMVDALVKSTKRLKKQRRSEGDVDEAEIKKEARAVLFDCIEMLTEAMLPMWLDHSKTLRLSVLEKVRKTAHFEKLVEFVKTYGDGLFTQAFFHLGNVRAILHRGVDAWLREVEEGDDQPDIRLFDELGSQLKRETAVQHLTLVLESVRENFNEYVDYNTTTTQSDHGDLLYSFLDFLRLRSRYDRVCWHLKPVVWAHRILVRQQENGVARMWRRSLNDRVGGEADKYLDLLQQLREKYSIQMSSVGRRLEGRFAHQLQIDRLRALVEPAMERPRTKESNKAFDLLCHESQAFLRSTSGVGVDLPEWLAELENEVQQFLLPRRLRDFWHAPEHADAQPLPIAELREKIEQLPRKE